MPGKWAADEVSGVTTSSAADPATAPAKEGVNVDANDVESRWWLQVSVGNFRLRALYDTEASRTVQGAVGLQMALALDRPITPTDLVKADARRW